MMLKERRGLCFGKASLLLSAFGAFIAVAANGTQVDVITAERYAGDSLETNFGGVILPVPLGLDWCIERARQANPELSGAIAAAEAERHRIDFVASFEDPRLAYEASNLPIGDFDFESTPLSGHQIGLHQKLPFPGLLSKRKAAAKKAARASELVADDRRNVVDGEVESIWSELGFAQNALDVTDRNIDLLRQLAATAESRYRVGSGLQQDVLRAQVELTVLLQERLRRVEAIAQAESRLMAILDLPPTTQIPRTGALQFSSEEPDLETLFTSLESRSVRIRSAKMRVEEAELQIRVAKLEGLPDVDVGIGYRVRQDVRGDPVHGDDFVSAGFTFRLPVQRSKWRARVATRRADLRRAEADLRSVRSTLFSLTRNAHAALVRATSEEALLETGLVPQARQSLEASRSAYKVGRIEFLSLLDSQVRLLGAELRLVRARADKRLAFAALESASGEKLR